MAGEVKSDSVRGLYILYSVGIDLEIIQKPFSIFFIDLLRDKCVVEIGVNMAFFFHFF